MGSRLFPYLALAGGVLAFSTSGVLAKLCTAEAIAIAFWVRLFSFSYLGAALLLSSSARRRHRPREGAVSYGVLGGCLFAVHLVFFFQALKWTSVTVVFLLSAVNPALVGLASLLFLGERPKARQAGWSALGMAAAACLVLMKDPSGAAHIMGNLCAVLATLGYCAYFIVSRRARQTIGTLEYMTVVTATSMLLIGVIGLVLQIPMSFGGARDLVILALMGLVPATGGHLLVNWSLRSVPAYPASNILLAVPVFASVWAYLVVGEQIGIGQVLAGLVILAAIPGALRTGAATVPTLR